MQNLLEGLFLFWYTRKFSCATTKNLVVQSENMRECEDPCLLLATNVLRQAVDDVLVAKKSKIKNQRVMRQLRKNLIAATAFIETGLDQYINTMGLVDRVSGDEIRAKLKSEIKKIHG